MASETKLNHLESGFLMRKSEKKGPNFWGILLLILRLTYLESSCNFRKFGFKKMVGIFFYYTGLQDPCLFLKIFFLWNVGGEKVYFACANFLSGEKRWYYCRRFTYQKACTNFLKDNTIRDGGSTAPIQKAYTNVQFVTKKKGWYCIRLFWIVVQR